MSGKAYSPEEVDEILRRALAREKDAAGHVKRDELVAAAGEVGIAPADVDAAIREMEEERAAKTSPSMRAAMAMPEADEHRKHELTRFYRHLGIFVVVNFALFMMDILSSGGKWFFWPLLGWGIGLGSHAVSVMFPKEPKLSRRERKRLMRDRAFETAVERGVEKMLEKRGARVDASDVNARVAGADEHDSEPEVERQRRAR